MKHPLTFTYTTGKTLTAELRDSTGVVLSQAMTEDAATGFYFITAATLAAPTLAAGTYSVRVSEPTDGVVGSSDLNWDGSKEVVDRPLGILSSVDDSTVTPTTTAFAGQGADLSATDDLYSSGGGMLVVFTSGALKGPPRPVVDYDGTTRTITVSPAFPAAPSNGDAFELIGRP